MDAMSRNLWGALILLSLWSGSAGDLQICLRRMEAGSGTCKVQLECSSLTDLSFEWFRGDTQVTSDRRHKLTFGGMFLDVAVDPELGETVYKCKNPATGDEQSVDLSETCRSSSISISYQYQKVKIIFTTIFLAVCTAAFLITFYLSRQQSSNSEKEKGEKQGDEGIYSDLLSPVLTQPDTKDPAQGTGQRAQGMSEGWSAQVEAGHAASLTRQQEAGLGTPQVVPVEDSTYTSLNQEPRNDDYQLLATRGPDGQHAVTYSAEAEDLTLQTAL